MTRGRKNNKLLTAFLIVLLLVAAMFGGWLTLPAFADTSAGYTGVLEDLQKDAAFSVSDYPRKSGDTSIQVIQIAESANGELFVYTYQPCRNTQPLTATSINMSLSESVEGTKLYKLKLLNSDDVFQKYVVEAFNVGAADVRYYNISTIYRPYISGDQKDDNDNTTNEKAFEVAKCFKAISANNTVYYECKETTAITILNPFADYLEYPNGFKLYLDYCHSHYVAFSTDKMIDDLQEATVSYETRKIVDTWTVYGSEIKRGEWSSEKKQLTGENKGGNPADGWFATKYEWVRIESVDNFLNDPQNVLLPETRETLKGKQWVLRFVETPYIVQSAVMGGSRTKTYWEVSNVTILRLKFVSKGVTYDLGAVMDKITGDDKPGNYPNNKEPSDDIFEAIRRFFIELWTKIKAFFKTLPPWAWLLVAAVVLLLFMPLLSLIFPAVGSILVSILKGALYVLKAVLKGLLWFLKSLVAGVVFLVTLPFKGIAALIRKIRGGKKK